MLTKSAPLSVPAPHIRRVVERVAPLVKDDPESATASMLRWLASAPDSDVGAVPAGPHYHLWRSETLLAVKSRDAARATTSIRLLGNLLAMPLLRRGTTRVRLPLAVGPAGIIHLSGAGCHLRGTFDGPIAEIAITGEQCRVRPGNGADLVLSGPGIAGSDLLVWHPVVAGTSIECHSTDPLVEAFLRRNAEQEQVDAYGRRGLTWTAESAGAAGRFTEAFETIRLVSPDDARTVVDNVQLIAPYTDARLVGFSSPLALGAVFIADRPGDPVHHIEHLLHEACHNALFRVQLRTRLHTASDDTLMDSPWRRDRRPVTGVVHGAYVFGRLATFFTKAVAAGGPLSSAFRHRRDACRGGFAIAYADLTATGYLSEAGASLLTALATELDCA